LSKVWFYVNEIHVDYAVISFSNVKPKRYDEVCIELDVNNVDELKERLKKSFGRWGKWSTCVYEDGDKWTIDYYLFP